MPTPDEPTDHPRTPPPYADKGDALILRDVLAIDRTRLANERTLLAWLRTGLMLLVSGVTLIKLFEGQTLLEVTGYVLIPLGLAASVLGVYRFVRMQARIETTRDV